MINRFYERERKKEKERGPRHIRPAGVTFLLNFSLEKCMDIFQFFQHLLVNR
jgi:hypothetical protein